MKLSQYFAKKFNVDYEDFIFDENMPINQQLDNLKQDLFQASYQNIIIDIGWLPEFDPAGNFVLQVIQDYDWQNPIYLQRTNNIMQLIEFIQQVQLSL